MSIYPKPTLVLLIDDVKFLEKYYIVWLSGVRTDGALSLVP